MNTLNFIIESSICLLLFISFYKIVLSRGKYFAFNRFYLLASFLFSVAIPFINIDIESNSTNYIAFLNEITISGNSSSLIVNESSKENFDYSNLIIVIYFAGILVLLSRLLIQLISLKIQFNKLNSLSNKSSLKVIETKRNISPFSFFNTIVVGNYSNTEEKQHIITHELGHIKNLHSIDKLYAEILTAIFWFNPFAWILKNELYLIHEFQADACTIKPENKISYMKTLVNLASINKSNILLNNFNQSFIKRRFKMITNEKVQKGKKSKLLLAVAFILGVGFIFACSNKSEELNNTTADKELIEVTEDIPVAEPETSTEVDDDSPIFTVVEQMPEFPGGKDAMMDFLSSNIKYPKEAKKSGASGTSFISFTIMKDGSIANVNLLRGFNDACDNEALRVVKSMPNWVPGKQKGETVKVQFNLPIKFKLDSKR